jgi:ABC-type transporter Mla subunit MlaD
MFVQRNQDGVIVAISRIEQPDCTEKLDENSSELTDFLAAADSSSDRLKQSDADLIRVIEDLIDLLTEKGVFQYTELPPKVQEKLNTRRKLRQAANDLDLLEEDSGNLPWP